MARNSSAGIGAIGAGAGARALENLKSGANFCGAAGASSKRTTGVAGAGYRDFRIEIRASGADNENIGEALNFKVSAEIHSAACGNSKSIGLEELTTRI